MHREMIDICQMMMCITSNALIPAVRLNMTFSSEHVLNEAQIINM